MSFYGQFTECIYNKNVKQLNDLLNELLDEIKIEACMHQGNSFSINRSWHSQLEFVRSDWIFSRWRDATDPRIYNEKRVAENVLKNLKLILPNDIQMYTYESEEEVTKSYQRKNEMYKNLDLNIRFDISEKYSREVYDKVVGFKEKVLSEKNEILNEIVDIIRERDAIARKYRLNSNFMVKTFGVYHDGSEYDEEYYSFSKHNLEELSNYIQCYGLMLALWEIYTQRDDTIEMIDVPKVMFKSSLICYKICEDVEKISW